MHQLVDSTLLERYCLAVLLAFAHTFDRSEP